MHAAKQNDEFLPLNEDQIVGYICLPELQFGLDAA